MPAAGLMVGTMLLVRFACPAAVAAPVGGTAYANGTVYLESGNTIFLTSPTLVGLNTVLDRLGTVPGHRVP